MNQDKLVAVPSAMRGLAALLLVAAVGCAGFADQEGGGGGGPSPLPYIQIGSVIADGTTNAGQGPFPVSFYGAGRVLDDATMTSLLARLHLSTWPEGTPIAVTPTIGSTSDVNRQTAQVSVGTPLANRWYALGFGPREAGLLSQQTFDGGVWGVRLRPDSHPAVSVAEFCGPTASLGMKFIVSFSEAVTVDAPTEALTVQQNGVAVSCQLYDVYPSRLYQFCGALTPAPVTVDLAAGTVRGPDGTFLAAQRWTVDIAKLPLVETRCNGYRIPL
jgi:hypothetical protein